MASSSSPTAETVILSEALDASNKPIIAVDIDEVLTPFVPLLIEFYNKHHLLEGQQPLDMKMFHSYHFRDVWDGSEERSKQIVDEFLQSELFLGQPILDETAFDVLQSLSTKYKLVIVTSRQHKLKEQTQMFLQKYFPNTFAEILMGNHYGETGQTQMTKPEMCRQLNAVLLIDDSLKYCQQCVDEKIPAILFGNYAWNVNSQPLDSHWIIRVDGWSQVEQAVETMLKQHNHI
ncbi:hypothetical protein FDP41_007277 [Naegleria fowleri]|uniref:FCP1 homology domain-containing protein n=1 Tax=Naegleria fowleri TaxID=5763 RepID=A0A6A5BIQ8_NAEFO|nr:uncharacterized protein FDP41_007277 [Naegleria fowleri]KAF0973890.1 hypothetical protein FDP41_007277 [Naegleria fowleri]CAG4711085.1 unnamed protein product [Naegleria fowleri]